MTATDRLFGGSVLRNLAVLAAAAMMLTLLPLAGTAMGQEQPDATDACPEEPAPAPFDDRDDIPDVHVRNVDCAYERNIVEGFADNTYRPSVPVRRDQMASYLARTIRAAGHQLPDPDEGDGFNDVPPGNVHSDNIESLQAAGIVRGVGGGNYNPGAPIRRDQVAAFALRAAEYALERDFQSGDQQFDDVPPGNVHFRDVNGAAEIGIIVGGPGNLSSNFFGPSLNTRRDQMAAIVARLLAFIEMFEEPVEPTPDPTPDPTGIPDVATFTTAPELVRCQPANVTTTQALIRFTYDEEVRAVPLPTGAYKLYPPDTRTTFTPSQVQRDANDPSSVLALFTRGEFDQATLCATAHGAAQDVDGNLNLEGNAPLQGATFTAGRTAAPDLLNVVLTAGTETQADFVFDQNIDTPAGGPFPARFHLVYADGTQHSGDSAVIQSDSRTVRVNFGSTGATGINQGQVRIAVADTGAVRAESGGALNPLQTVTFGNGQTALPDLIGVTYNFAADTVDYHFSESVDTGGTATGFPERFNIYYRDGFQRDATAAYNVSALTVRAHFPAGTVNQTVAGASADTGAVRAAGTDTRQSTWGEFGREQTFAAGGTFGPLLTDARRVTTTDAFGNVTGMRVEYVFDRAVETPTAGQNFVVYAADGTRTIIGTWTGAGSPCRLGAATEVHCDIPTGQRTAVGNAVVGAVEYRAAASRGTGDLPAGMPNPEDRAGLS